MLNRRQMLQRVALLMGGTVSASSMTAILSACRLMTTNTRTPQTLTPAQDELVATLAELIIPTTDTPGARAAGANVFIDLMLTHVHTSQERAHFLAGLADLDDRARAGGSVNFVACPTQTQIQLLEALEAQSPVPRPPATDPPPFFHMLKELTLVGYYTSEIGATQELKYVHVAGTYDGDVPLEQIGRAYS